MPLQPEPNISEYTRRDWELLYYCVSDEKWNSEEYDFFNDSEEGSRLSDEFISRSEWLRANGFDMLIYNEDEDEEEPYWSREQILPYMSWNLGYTENQLIRLYQWTSGDYLLDEDSQACENYFSRHSVPDSQTRAQRNSLGGGNYFSREEALNIREGEDRTVVVLNKNIIVDPHGRFAKVDNKQRITRAREIVEKYEGLLPSVNLRGLVKTLLGDLFIFTKNKVDLSQVYFETLEQIRLEEQQEKKNNPQPVQAEAPRRGSSFVANIIQSTRPTARSMPPAPEGWQRATPGEWLELPTRQGAASPTYVADETIATTVAFDDEIEDVEEAQSHG